MFKYNLALNSSQLWFSAEFLENSLDKKVGVTDLFLSDKQKP
jgi:hypothetical protein